MRLRNPGAIMPPPPLDGYAARIAAAVESLPGVVAHTHWLLGDPETVDGAEYHLGDVELGHVHLDGSVHLPMGPLAAPLVAAGLAVHPPWSRSWVSLSGRAVDDAAWLFSLAHDRASGTPDAPLCQRIRDRAPA